MRDVNQPAEPAAAEGCELFTPLRLTGGRRPSPLARQVAAGLGGDIERVYEFVVWLLQDVNAIDAAAEVDRLLWALQRGLPVQVQVTGTGPPGARARPP
jgi:hypothetical protein